jgi:hypothetical protein
MIRVRGKVENPGKIVVVRGMRHAYEEFHRKCAIPSFHSTHNVKRFETLREYSSPLEDELEVRPERFPSQKLFRHHETNAGNEKF